MSIINKALGKRIKEFRNKKGLTQEELAFQSKLDFSYFNQIERGKRNPSIEAVERVAKALGVNFKDLFE